MKKKSYIVFIILAVASLYLITNFFIKHRNLQKKSSQITKNIDVNQIQQENNFSSQSNIKQTILEKNNTSLEGSSKEDPSNNKQTNSNPIKENISKNNIPLFADDLITKISLNDQTQNNFSFTQIDLIETNPIYENNDTLQSKESLNDIPVEIKPFSKEGVDINLSENKDLEDVNALQKDKLSSSENNKLSNEIIDQIDEQNTAQISKETNSNISNIDFTKINSLSFPNSNFQTINLFKIFTKDDFIKEKEKENIKDNTKITTNCNSNEKIDSKPSDNPCVLPNSKKKLSQIIVANNQYTKSDFLKKRIKIKPGDYINEKKLQEHLNFINLNPFRKVALIIDPKQDNNCDIDLICHDRFFVRPYLGFDNTGLKIIGKNRVYAGFDWNNPFTLDSILSYQYLSSANFKKFQSHTGSWTFFLPWENFLTLYASYAYIDVDHMIPYIEKRHGSALQTSLRYNICLPIINLISHDLILGFDFKRTDTNLIFSRFSALDDTFVNLTQFLFSYGLNRNNNFYNTKLLLELYFSLGPMVSDQEDSRYNNLRRFSKNQYVYAKGYFFNLIKIPKDFLLSLILSGQISNENLLPSETFSIGGYNTVRGYNERQVNTDSGFIVNLELRCPSQSFLSKKCINDSFRIIFFFDYGNGFIKNPMPFEDKNSYLIGFGPGLRYVINPYLTTRLDWGIKGKNNHVPDKAKSFCHFSVNLSY